MTTTLQYVISTYAGTGTAGSTGDGLLASVARLNAPQGLALDNSNNIYIADYKNNKIRMVNISTGIITTFAGTGIAGSGGDNGAATNALLSTPIAVAYASGGDVYIVDFGNFKIRKVNSSGIITTFAGTGVQGISVFSGQATSATFYYPSSLTLDGQGNHPPLFFLSFHQQLPYPF